MSKQDEIDAIVAKYGEYVEPNSTINNLEFVEILQKHGKPLDHDCYLILNTPLIIAKDANGRLKHKII